MRGDGEGRGREEGARRREQGGGRDEGREERSRKGTRRGTRRTPVGGILFDVT